MFIGVIQLGASVAQLRDPTFGRVRLVNGIDITVVEVMIKLEKLI